MTDYQPNLREIACVLKHKAHLSFSKRSQTDSCIYCKGDVQLLGHAGEPAVAVFESIHEISYIVPKGQGEHSAFEGQDGKPVGADQRQRYETFSK